MQESFDAQIVRPLPLRSKSTQAYQRREMAQVLPVLRNIAHQCQHFRKFPLLRILKDIARLFLLTFTQALFFMFVVRETEWGVEDGWMRAYSSQVKDLLCFLHEDQEYREMLLYLLLASYSVKECLNSRQPLLLYRANKICPQFSPALKEWSLRHANIIKDIHPRLLNRLCMQLSQTDRRTLHQQEQDYMSTVDEILEICRPYSETRVDKQKERMEILKREAEVELWSQKPQKRRKLEKNFEGQLCATFTEVIEMGSTGDYCDELMNNRFNELGIALDGGKETVGLPDCVANTDDDYCESFNLSPHHESEEHIIFLKKEPNYQLYSLRFFVEESEQHLM